MPFSWTPVNYYFSVSTSQLSMRSPTEPIEKNDLQLQIWCDQVVNWHTYVYICIGEGKRRWCTRCHDINFGTILVYTAYVSLRWNRIISDIVTEHLYIIKSRRENGVVGFSFFVRYQVLIHQWSHRTLANISGFYIKPSPLVS